MKVKCDECGNEFIVTLKQSKVSDEIVHHYFECTECNHRYSSYYTNSKVRSNQLQIALLRSNIAKSKNKKEIKRMVSKINKLTEANKTEMAMLKNKFGA